MSRLTQVSLVHRTVVLLLSLLVVGVGLYTASALKQELIPNITIPRATIVSAYVGATPETVERDVTKPLEDAVKGVSGVTAVTSKSTSGLSQVRVEWDYDSNADKISTDVRNAVESAKSKLPTDVNPTIIAGSFDDIPIVVLSVSATSKSQEELSRELKDIAIPALKSVPGVRDVTLAGERARQVVVTLRQKDVDRLGVDVNTLPALFAANGLAIPAGTVRTGTANLDVQVGTSFASLDEIKNMWVQGTDGPVRLNAVASVSEQSVDLTSISRANGQPALTLLVTKQESGNTVAVANGVSAQVPRLTQQLGPGVTFATIFNQAPYIEQSVHDLSVEGGLGLAMAVFVILVFLRSIRPTIISAISIPLSLCIALIGLWIGGFTLNIITLGALTVAIGRVVDDSIVVIENIKRHMSLGRYGTPAIVTAVKEVAGAVTSSTLTTVAVFLPIGLVGGQTAVIFRPFAVTVTVSLLASLAVALTVVPVLAAWFMRRPTAAAAAKEEARLEADQRAVEADRARDQATFDAKAAALTARMTKAKRPGDRIAARVETLRARYGLTHTTALDAASERHAEHAAPQTWLQRAYLPALRWALGHRLLTLLLALLVFGGTMSLAPLLKTDFIGEAGQTSLQIIQTLPAGTSLEETDAAAKRVEGLIEAEPTVETFSTSVGSSGAALGITGGTDSNQASYSITLKPKSDGLAAADRLRAGIADLGQPGTTEVFVGRSSSDVIVYVETPDQTKLAEANQQVLDLLHTIPDLSNVKSDLTEARSMLAVDVDEKAAAKAGMTQASIGGAALRAIRGQKVGTLREGETSLDIVLRSRKPVKSIDELRQSLLPVTAKQTMDARQAAADKVTAASDEFAAQQKSDGYASYQDGLRSIRSSRAKAVKQLNSLLSALSKLQKALRQILANPPPPGTVIPTDPTAAIRQQIASVQSGIAGARAQIKALDAQYTKTVEGYVKAQATQDRSKALQQAGKDAAKAKAKPLKLHQVADVHEVKAPATITRVGGQRTATVSATPTGSNLGATTAAIKQGLAGLKLPPGVSVRIGGVSQQQQESFAQLGLAMLVAVAVVYLIMVATFGSLLQPLILLVSIPFAATGAIGLSLLTDTPLGLPSMIGLLMLIGIVVTNAIVLIDLINQYRRDGAGLDDSIMHGARLRLRPIVMTALATIMALVPMGLGVTGGGVFISKPLAIVVIGGLVSSTVLTLVLVPVLYDIVERLRGRGRTPGAAADAEVEATSLAPAAPAAAAPPAPSQQAVPDVRTSG